MMWGKVAKTYLDNLTINRQYQLCLTSFVDVAHRSKALIFYKYWYNKPIDYAFMDNLFNNLCLKLIFTN